MWPIESHRHHTFLTSGEAESGLYVMNPAAGEWSAEVAVGSPRHWELNPPFKKIV